MNLGRRIPEDHLLRRLQKVLRLEFVGLETEQFYGHNGPPVHNDQTFPASVPPLTEPDSPILDGS